MVQRIEGAYEGEDVPIVCAFTNSSDGSPQSADVAPTITVTEPDSGTDVVSGASMTEGSTGVYEHVWDTAADGEGTGTYNVEVTGEFSSETKIVKGTIRIS